MNLIGSIILKRKVMQFRKIPTILFVTLTLVAPANAQEDTNADLQAAAQNPIGSLVSLPFKFSFDNGAPNGNANVLQLQPVIPVSLGDWNMVNRFIIPLYDAPGGVPGLPGNSGEGLPSTERFRGLGDINYTMFFSPSTPVNGWTWGIGPSLTAPTAANSNLGAGKWSGGISAVALTQPEWGNYGGLIRQLWSFAGDDDRDDVSQTLIEPFINYNLDDGWYLTGDYVITYNWKAAKGQEWVVPIGGGFGRMFEIGSQKVNAKAEAYYNVVRPDAAPEWSLGLTFQLLFPKSG